MNLENELSRICQGAQPRSQPHADDADLDWSPMPFGRRVAELRPKEDALEDFLLGAEDDEPLSWAA